MISFPLLKNELKSIVKMLVIFMILLTLYIVIIVYMFDPKLTEMLKAFEEAMPGMMSAFGMVVTGTDLLSFLNSYLFGFLLLIFPMVFTIMLANRLVAKHVDSGSMVCILSSPNTRRKIVVTQISVMLICVFILILYSTVVAIITSEILFPGELNIKNYILMNIGLFALHLTISGISFSASCIFNETKNSYLFGAGIPIIFFLIKMLANMGDKLQNLKYATIFSLLPADKIAAGDTEVFWQISALFLIAVCLYSAAAYIFMKKDMPI